MGDFMLKNCPDCGQVFRTWGGTLCPECTKRNQTEFEAVKNYLRTHRGASIEDTTLTTGVDVHKIVGWLRDGQLFLK